MKNKSCIISVIEIKCVSDAVYILPAHATKALAIGPDHYPSDSLSEIEIF